MQPSTVINRLDLGFGIQELDLEMNRRGYIGHQVFPVVTRNKPEGEFPKVKLESLLQSKKTARSPGGGFPRSEGDWTKDTYSTEEAGHEAPIDRRTVRRWGDIIDAEQFETNRVTNIVLQAAEQQLAALLFNAATFGGNKNGNPTAAWSSRSTAVPLADIDAKREVIFTNFGSEPNALIVNRKVFRNLRACDSIVDKIKAQNFQDVRPSQITPQMLAAALDLEMVIVAGAAQNTANPSDARTLTRIWGDANALLCKVAMTNDPSEPCIGRTVVWDERGAIDGDRLAVIVEEYEEPRVDGTVIRARTDWEHKLLFAEAGFLFTNVT